MEVSIKGRALDLSAALRDYTERRFRLSIGAFAKQLQSVDVRLSDVNGPRGGIDKRCAVTAILEQFGVVFARAKGASAYATVDRAASRIRSALTRRLSRRHATRRLGRRLSITAGEDGFASRRRGDPDH